MPVKYWSKAGLCLTDWCNAACASCYMQCGPGRDRWMAPPAAVDLWRRLERLSPHGCRVHLTGGEPFGRYETLLETLRLAGGEGLAGADVETNAFWATDEGEIRRRLDQLDRAGLRRLDISADPYHQRFVPIDRPRRLRRLAAETLGPARVRVRWDDWLDRGCDTAELAPPAWDELARRWALAGRDRHTGRGSALPAGGEQLAPLEDFADKPCREVLLRGKGVHVGPDGSVFPATCVGLRVGDAFARPIEQIWRDLHPGGSARPMLSTLSAGGPAALLRETGLGVDDLGADRFAGKCHLCWLLRRALVRRDGAGAELGPATLY